MRNGWRSPRARPSAAAGASVGLVTTVPSRTLAMVSWRADGLTGFASQAAIAASSRSRTPIEERMTTAIGEGRHATGELEAVELRHEEVEEGDIERLAALQPGDGLLRRPGLTGDHS